MTTPEVRTGSDPAFCPPVEEGETFTFTDEAGDDLTLEFLGLLLYGQARYGFFFPVDDDHPALSSGEVVILEVTDLDDEGQPAAFELLTDETLAQEVYAAFRQATRDLYRFE